MNQIIRVAVAPKQPRKGEAGVFIIYNFELPPSEVEKLSLLYPVLHDDEVEMIVNELPDGDFHEVMYKPAIIDPQSKTIGAACKKLGINVEALKVSIRYYGNAFEGITVNPNVEICFTEEPRLETLKPVGERVPMETYNLMDMSDDQLALLSQELNLSLSLAQMQKIRNDQAAQNLPFVTDLMLDVYAILWCDHCSHTWWQALGQLLKKLRQTTAEINNPNVLSAFTDNAGVWDFYDEYVLVFGGETHNSPSRKFTFGGQITKTVGHDRDIYMTGLGAKPIAHLEMTTVGEFVRRVYPVLERHVFSEAQVARETVAAVAKAGNTTGISMNLARMYSHPAFGVKPFAFGGTLGITTKEVALKGLPQPGDEAWIVGNKSGNDGYHGGTVASGALSGVTESAAADHVQLGDPFTQQKMMQATFMIRDSGCARARNDFGAGGFISAFGEMGQPKTLPWGISYAGGLLLNFALPPLKCAGLPDKVLAIGESQERFAFVIIPEKVPEFVAICELMELECTRIGVFTGNGRLQIIRDETVREFTKDTPLSGEILLDLPYDVFENCPLPEVKVIEPPPKAEAKFPAITMTNVEDMAAIVVGHFDNCKQARAQRQYDSGVQGIRVQGPLYGRNYNVGSHLGVSRPVYRKPYAATTSMCFAPWLYEVDPVAGVFNCFMDAYMTQVAAGVNPGDICLVENFYSPNRDPYAPWYVIKQVEILCQIQKSTGPIINGKDSNYGSAEYEGQVINIPPSVNLMALGKFPDYHQLILHQWHYPDNLLYSLGKRAISLAGSTLASALEIAGGKVDTIPMDEVKHYVQKLHAAASNGFYHSAVPVNRGGLILRLFEGVEASGLGVETDLCAELFPESFGTVLVEVKPEHAVQLENIFGEDALCVGRIVDGKGIAINGQRLCWERLFQGWNTRFAKEVYNA
ncbi:MAG: AIR synthase-related protein [Patescibacteria group bacterium]|nr:AIR synthase-related protein [Patescibacteria group bacterium]